MTVIQFPSARARQWNYGCIGALLLNGLGWLGFIFVVFEAFRP